MKALRRNLLVAAPALLASLPALADEGGLPQFDTRFFPGQIVWLALSFGFLYLMMALIALPRVTRTQGNRKAVIAAEVDAARAASETAKATVAEVEKALAQARSAAQASVGEMIARMAEEGAARQGTQEKDLARRLRASEESIAVAREAAMKNISGSAKELADGIVDKILARRAA